MHHSKMLSIQFLVGFGFVGFVASNSIPSLLSTNATLAIVIDREYLGENYDSIQATIQHRIDEIKRDILKHGGLNILYYYWTSITIRKEITAILSIAPCIDTWKLFKIADAEEILHMAISETDCPRLPTNQGFIIPTVVRGEELPQILLDLRSIRAYDWKSVVVLYDDSLGRDFVTRVLTSLTINTKELISEGTAISLIKLDDENTRLDKTKIMNTLSTFAPTSSASNFLVVVSTELVTYIMQAAQALNLMDINRQWLYVISDDKLDNDSTDEILHNLKEGNNIALLYNISTSGTACKEGIECYIHEMLSAFAKALDSAIVDEFELASQVSDEEWDAIRPTKLERRNYLLATTREFVLKDGVCGNCTAWQIKACDTWGKEFKSASSSKFDLISVGYWELLNGPSMIDVLFPHVVHGFRRRSFPLVSLHNPPWQIIETNSSGGIICTGIVFNILNELAKSLNFTYTVIALNDGKNELKNSSYYGKEISYRVTYTIPDAIVKMIQNKEVFIAAYAYTITEESKRLVNFTIPISTQAYTLLGARPKELSRALLFVSPLSYSTWLCLLTTIAVMGPILYYIHKFSPVNEYYGISVRGGLSSVYNCVWYIYGALLQQGGLYLPHADSARLLMGSWWLVVLVISTTYCGNLVAFLTFPNNDKPITTLSELLSRRETVTWSIAPATFFEYEIKMSTEEKYQTLYHGSLRTVSNMEEMIENIEMGKHIHIDWKLRLQYMMKKQLALKDTCSLSLGIEDFFNEQLGLIVSQDNPYLQRINREIKRLHQVGLIEKWLKDYLPKRDKCFKTKSSGVVNNHIVNLDDMQGCFFMLFLGCSMAFLLMCGERFYCRYQKLRKKKVVQPFVS